MNERQKRFVDAYIVTPSATEAAGRASGKSWNVARMLLLRVVERPMRVLCAQGGSIRGRRWPLSRTPWVSNSATRSGSGSNPSRCWRSRRPWRSPKSRR